MHRQIVITEAGNCFEFLDIVIPPRQIPFGRTRGKCIKLVMVDLVAESVRDRIGIGPLHREALLDEEVSRCAILLVAVA